MPLDLSLKHILLERALGHLLLELAFLGNEQLFFAVDLHDHLAMLHRHLFNLLVHLLDLGLLGDDRRLRLLYIAIAVGEELRDL